MTALPEPPLPTLLSRFWGHLAPRRRVQYAVFTGLVLVSAFTEVVSLGAVLPFLGVLTAPERVFAHPLAQRLAQALGITTAQGLVLPVTLGFMAMVVGAGAFRLFLLWVSARLTGNVGGELSIAVYRRTLYQPCQTHLARNSSEIIGTITGTVSSLINHVLEPLQSLLTSLVITLAILVTLFVINPWVAAVAILGFGGSYALVSWAVRHRLHRNGQVIHREYLKVLKCLQEGLGGIRDVLLDGTQPTYCQIYEQADLTRRRAAAHNSLIGQSPRYIMEAAGMVLIAGLAYSLYRGVGTFTAALPLLGALALGAQRLLPALQQAYQSWGTITASRAALAKALDLLDQPLPPEALTPRPSPLPFRVGLAFEAVRFRYAEDGPWVLDGLDLSIPKGSRVALVGSTGCGKSTTLDVVMGLLPPTGGRILVDGVPLEGARLRAWQRAIAHVPQAIYLADTSLAENIAFGVPLQDIELDRVQRAARLAQIAPFIESRPKGYQALVGERGVRLSGGQRQRIGIARAIYKQAALLIFDEATSALDTVTERAVMAAIQELDREITILIVAHRLSTVQSCEVILEMAGGKVVAQGTYGQLLDQSESFRRMAQVSQS